MRHAVVDVTTNEKLFFGTRQECETFMLTCDREFAHIFRTEWSATELRNGALSYKQARAHAQQCGVNVSRFVAVPIERMKRKEYKVAQDVLHPETLDSIHDKDQPISKEWAQFLSLHTGIDYIVCYK